MMWQFARVLTTEDVFNMAPIEMAKPKEQKKLTKKEKVQFHSMNYSRGLADLLVNDS